MPYLAVISAGTANATWLFGSLKFVEEGQETANVQPVPPAEVSFTRLEEWYGKGATRLDNINPVRTADVDPWPPRAVEDSYQS